MLACPCGTATNVLDCDTVVCEFEIQSRSLLDKYPWEKYESAYTTIYGLNNIITIVTASKTQ